MLDRQLSPFSASVCRIRENLPKEGKFLVEFSAMCSSFLCFRVIQKPQIRSFKISLQFFQSPLLAIIKVNNFSSTSHRPSCNFLCNCSHFQKLRPHTVQEHGYISYNVVQIGSAHVWRQILYPKLRAKVSYSKEIGQLSSSTAS